MRALAIVSLYPCSIIPGTLTLFVLFLNDLVVINLPASLFLFTSELSKEVRHIAAPLHNDENSINIAHGIVGYTLVPWDRVSELAPVSERRRVEKLRSHPWYLAILSRISGFGLRSPSS